MVQELQSRHLYIILTYDGVRVYTDLAWLLYATQGCYCFMKTLNTHGHLASQISQECIPIIVCKSLIDCKKNL